MKAIAMSITVALLNRLYGLHVCMGVQQITTRIEHVRTVLGRAKF